MTDDKVKLDDLKGNYVHLPFLVGRKKYTAQVKFEDEGVVIDIFDKDGEVVETTWRIYSEIADGDEVYYEDDEE